MKTRQAVKIFKRINNEGIIHKRLSRSTMIAASFIVDRLVSSGRMTWQVKEGRWIPLWL